MSRFLRNSTTALLKQKLRKTSAVAGSVTLSPYLQDGDNPFGWLGEFFSNIGEFITVLAENVFIDVPTTPLEIIDFFFGDSLAATLDEFYQNLLVMRPLENTLFYWILFIASAIGFLVVVIKLSGYVLKWPYYMSPPKNYTAEQILRGESPLVSPVSYLLWQLPVTLFVVLMSPALFAGTYTVLREVVRQTVLAVYSDTTIGGATYEIILNMLEGRGLIWFGLAFSLFIILFALFLLVYAFVNIAVILTAAWTTIQVARYGDGESTFVVITDAAITNIKAWAVLLVMFAEILIGPAVLSETALGWFPTALGIIVWLSIMIASPVILIWAWPKAERVIVARAKQASVVAREFVSPQGRYYPRQRFLDLSEDRYAQEEGGLGLRERVAQAASRTREIYDAYQRVMFKV